MSDPLRLCSPCAASWPDVIVAAASAAAATAAVGNWSRRPPLRGRSQSTCHLTTSRKRYTTTLTMVSQLYCSCSLERVAQVRSSLSLCVQKLRSFSSQWTPAKRVSWSQMDNADTETPTHEGTAHAVKNLNLTCINICPSCLESLGLLVTMETASKLNYKKLFFGKSILFSASKTISFLCEQDLNKESGWLLEADSLTEGGGA